MSEKLKYLGYSIVFQEIPDEVSLSINISGCPHRCEGCHSKYLWEYDGRYISDDIDDLIKKYDGLITCVCFMGGDQNFTELLSLLQKVKNKGLKTALYSGIDSLIDIDLRVLLNLNYIKIGHYDESKGGLDNPETNQKLLKWNLYNSYWDDITYRLRKSNEEKSKNN